jgi:hypothetical protein
VRRRIGLSVSRGALRESWLTLAPSFGRATEQKFFALYKKALRYRPKKSNRGMPYDEYRECLACGALSDPKKFSQRAGKSPLPSATARRRHQVSWDCANAHFYSLRKRPRAQQSIVYGIGALLRCKIILILVTFHPCHSTAGKRELRHCRFTQVRSIEAYIFASILSK